mgnify:CR=1 FL=1
MEIIEMRQKELPNATTVLILGILSLVFCWFVGLILGIVAVALASGSRQAYYANPDEFTESSFRNLRAGRVCGIIGICIGLAVLAFMLLMIVGVTALSVGSSLLLG